MFYLHDSSGTQGNTTCDQASQIVDSQLSKPANSQSTASSHSGLTDIEMQYGLGNCPMTPRLSQALTNTQPSVIPDSQDMICIQDDVMTDSQDGGAEVELLSSTDSKIPATLEDCLPNSQDCANSERSAVVNFDAGTSPIQSLFQVRHQDVNPPEKRSASSGVSGRSLIGSALVNVNRPVDSGLQGSEYSDVHELSDKIKMLSVVSDVGGKSMKGANGKRAMKKVKGSETTVNNCLPLAVEVESSEKIDGGIVKRDLYQIANMTKHDANMQINSVRPERIEIKGSIKPAGGASNELACQRFITENSLVLTDKCRASRAVSQSNKIKPLMGKTMDQSDEEQQQDSKKLDKFNKEKSGVVGTTVSNKYSPRRSKSVVHAKDQNLPETTRIKHYRNECVVRSKSFNPFKQEETMAQRINENDGVVVSVNRSKEIVKPPDREDRKKYNDNKLAGHSSMQLNVQETDQQTSQEKPCENKQQGRLNKKINKEIIQKIVQSKTSALSSDWKNCGTKLKLDMKQSEKVTKVRSAESPLESVCNVVENPEKAIRPVRKSPRQSSLVAIKPSATKSKDITSHSVSPSRGLKSNDRSTVQTKPKFTGSLSTALPTTNRETGARAEIYSTVVTASTEKKRLRQSYSQMYLGSPQPSEVGRKVLVEMERPKTKEVEAVVKKIDARVESRPEKDSVSEKVEEERMEEERTEEDVETETINHRNTDILQIRGQAEAKADKQDQQVLKIDKCSKVNNHKVTGEKEYPAKRQVGGVGKVRQSPRLANKKIVKKNKVKQGSRESIAQGDEAVVKLTKEIQLKKCVKENRIEKHHLEEKDQLGLIHKEAIVGEIPDKAVQYTNEEFVGNANKTNSRLTVEGLAGNSHEITGEVNVPIDKDTKWRLGKYRNELHGRVNGDAIPRASVSAGSLECEVSLIRLEIADCSLAANQRQATPPLKTNDMGPSLSTNEQGPSLLNNQRSKPIKGQTSNQRSRTSSYIQEVKPRQKPSVIIASMAPRIKEAAGQSCSGRPTDVVESGSFVAVKPVVEKESKKVNKVQETKKTKAGLSKKSVNVLNESPQSDESPSVRMITANVAQPSVVPRCPDMFDFSSDDEYGRSSIFVKTNLRGAKLSGRSSPVLTSRARRLSRRDTWLQDYHRKCNVHSRRSVTRHVARDAVKLDCGKVLKSSNIPDKCLKSEKGSKNQNEKRVRDGKQVKEITIQSVRRINKQEERLTGASRPISKDRIKKHDVDTDSMTVSCQSREDSGRGRSVEGVQAGLDHCGDSENVGAVEEAISHVAGLDHQRKRYVSDLSKVLVGNKVDGGQGGRYSILSGEKNKKVVDSKNDCAIENLTAKHQSSVLFMGSENRDSGAFSDNEAFQNVSVGSSLRARVQHGGQSYVTSTPSTIDGSMTAAVGRKLGYLKDRIFDSGGAVPSPVACLLTSGIEFQEMPPPAKPLRITVEPMQDLNGWSYLYHQSDIS